MVPPTPRAILVIVVAAAVTLTGLIALVPDSGSPSLVWRWVNQSGAVSPPAQGGSVLAFDSVHDRYLMFGGDLASPTNLTWSFDPKNATWTNLSPSVAPPPRADAMLAFDPGQDEFILFGGWGEYPNETYFRYNDTWSFSFGVDQWTPLAVRGAPPPRSDSAVAFDAADGRFVIFGGFVSGQYLRETWSLDPVAKLWVRLAPPCGFAPTCGPYPGARADGRMVYDSLEKTMILFGGNDFTGPNFSFHHLNDTWELDPANGSWAERFPLVHPSPRDYPIEGFDPSDGWVLLFGGFGNRTFLGDTWAYSPPNDSWWRLGVPEGPPARFAAVGGYDPLDRSLLVANGAGVSGGLNDTWTLRPFAPGGVASAEVSALEVGSLGAAVVVPTVLGTVWRMQRRAH